MILVFDLNSDFFFSDSVWSLSNSSWMKMKIAFCTYGLVFLLDSTFALQETNKIDIYENCNEDSKVFNDSLDLEKSGRNIAQNFSEWLPSILNVFVFGGFPEVLREPILAALLSIPCVEPFYTVFDFIGGAKCFITAGAVLGEGPVIGGPKLIKSTFLEVFINGLFKLFKWFVISSAMFPNLFLWSYFKVYLAFYCN